MVKKDKPDVPRQEKVYDSGNEPSDEDDLRAYQSRFRILVGAQGEAGQSSTQPPPIATPEPSPTRSVSPNRNPGTLGLFLFYFSYY